MAGDRSAKYQDQTAKPVLGLMQLSLLIGAVFAGLLSMHVFMAPTMEPAPSRSAPESVMVTHDALDHEQTAPAGSHEDGECANCPMEHQMSAVGCILALLAMLLFLRPPGLNSLGEKPEHWTRVLVCSQMDIAYLKPDLTALGICRT